MSSAVISPGALRGSLRVPPSKSAAHRLLLCAALAGGGSTVRNLSGGDDLRVTLQAAAALGAKISVENNTIRINSTEYNKKAEIDCGESGSSLRFLLPICAALGISASFTGRGRLPQRPLGEYLTLLPAHGVACETTGGLPLAITGQLQPGRFALAGDVSSQFVTGLLLALPLLRGDSELLLTSPLESAGYVEMTLQAMALFGVKAEAVTNGWHISGGQAYRPCDCEVEGDWSQAAFWLAAGALGSQLELTGLSAHSAQGDLACAELFAAFGANIATSETALQVSPGTLSGIDIDAAQVPDLVPALAATAALAKGETRIYNAQRLRIKESDRLKAMADAINAMGGRARETADGLRIIGVETLRSATVNGCNDHRVVMAAAVAALRAGGPITVTDAQSVNKSYPDFWGDYSKLGGAADVVNLG